MTKGVTLLEILLVIGVLALMGGVGLGFYFGYSSNIDLEEEVNRIVSYLNQAKGNAMAIEQGLPWGVRFDNVDSANPFFALFTGADYASSGTTTKAFLSAAVEYQSPSAGGFTEIVFSRRGGTTTAQIVITVRLRDQPEMIKNIDISALGLISR